MLALPGASGVLAATGDEPASAGFWAAVDSVGKLYAIKGRQIADVEEMRRSLSRALHDESVAHSEDEELAAIEAVRGFKGRIRCASLAWEALDDALRQL